MKTPKPFSRNYPAYMEQKRKEAEARAAEIKRAAEPRKVEDAEPQPEKEIPAETPAPQPDKREKKKRKNKWGSDVENREDKSFNEFDTK